MFTKKLKNPFLIFIIIIYILIVIFLLLNKKNFEKKNKNYDEEIDNNIIYVGRKLTSFCNYLICPEGNGFCRADRCVCLPGYVTYNEKEEKNKKFCNYKQKSVLTALILESIGLIGCGHLYAGRIFSGFFKIIIFYAIICFGTQFVIELLKESSETDFAFYVKNAISIGCIGTPLIWHFIDLYNFAFNKYLDGNGIPMKDW